jgi:CARDB
MLPFSSFFEELDFGEEPPPKERRGPRMPGRGGGGGRDDEGPDDPDDDDRPRRGGIGGGGVEIRRIALVVVAVVILLIGGYWYVQRCQRDQEVDAYKSYVQSANAVTADANRVGKALQTTLLKQGQTAAQLQTDMNEIAKNQQAVVTAADGLSAPGTMKELQARFLEAQQLRLNGLKGVAGALPKTFQAAKGTVSTEQAAVVALLFGRVYAGDIVYSDSFKGPAVKLLDDQDVSGVALDDSQYVNADLLPFLDPAKMAARLTTIAGGAPPPSGDLPPECATDPTAEGCKPPTTTGLHGTSIETVTISGTTLNADDVTEVTTDPDNQNSIVVAVKNGGDFQETQVDVQAFIDSEQVGDTGTIAVFDAGTTANVTFKFEPLFNKAKQSVKIVVKPVAGEENTANNSRTYQVIFKFPG